MVIETLLVLQTLISLLFATGLQVFINHQGAKHAVDVPKEASVYHLRRAISETLGDHVLDEVKWCFTYQGDKLIGDIPLADAGVGQESVVELVSNDCACREFGKHECTVMCNRLGCDGSCGRTGAGCGCLDNVDPPANHACTSFCRPAHFGCDRTCGCPGNRDWVSDWTHWLNCDARTIEGSV